MKQNWEVHHPIDIKDWENNLLSGKWSIDDENEEGDTLLHWACNHANEKAVALCSRFNANPFIPNLKARIPEMVWIGPFLESRQDGMDRDESIFLKYFPEYPENNRNFWTLFGILDSSFIESQFKKGLTPSENYYDMDLSPQVPLFEALPVIKDFQIVELFLKYGADPSVVNNCKLGVLHFALQSPCPEVWSWATDMDRDFFRVNQYYQSTPLAPVFKQGVEMWNFLKKFKINWNLPCYCGLPPILAAARFAKNTDWISWLIEAGCDPLVKFTYEYFTLIN